MTISVLFSGGKDSGLSAILLEPFFDDMELVTFSFGRNDDCWPAVHAARELGHPHRIVVFDEAVLDRAVAILMSTGYPNDALDYVHSAAVEILAQECEFVADGTRRDDRSPKMDFSSIRSLEGRTHVQYIRPLAGLGVRAIKFMASQYLDFEEVPSEKYPASDFEVGLRHALARRCGKGEEDRIFHKRHSHTRIIRRKRVVQEVEGQEDQACQGIQSES